MTFAYYAGPEAVKGLQKFHDKGEKVTQNALKKLDGILMPGFYQKVAEEMQEEKTTLQSLQNSFHDIILEQWVAMHPDHPHNGQYVRPEKGVYHRRDVGSVSALVCYTFTISVLSQGHAHPQRGCCTWKACPEGDSWYMGLLAGT